MHSFKLIATRELRLSRSRAYQADSIEEQIYWDIRVCVACGCMQIKDDREEVMEVIQKGVWRDKDLARISQHDKHFHRQLSKLVSSITGINCDEKKETR